MMKTDTPEQRRGRGHPPVLDDPIRIVACPRWIQTRLGDIAAVAGRSLTCSRVCQSTGRNTMANEPVHFTRARIWMSAVFGTFALISAGVIMAPSAASAAPRTVHVARGMQLVGFDATAARLHGYTVVTLPDGAQASVPAAKAGAARAGTYQPQAGVLRAA